MLNLYCSSTWAPNVHLTPRKIMKKYLSCLIFVFSICCVSTASSQFSRSVLIELLEYAAHMEFGYAKNAGEDAIKEAGYLKKAERALTVAYEVLRELQDGAPSEIEDELAAYTLSRVGWFSRKTTTADFSKDYSESLIREANRLDPDNNVYKYMVAMISNIEERERILERIIEDDPSFMEALDGLLGVRLRQKDFDRADALRIRYLDHLADFHPQLWNFDHSYPPKLAHIFIEKGRILERKKYNSSLDRFKYHPE